MEIENGATLEMVENLLDGSTPAGRALQADSAGSAATATNAVNAQNDGSGNNIAATYATKSELAQAGGFDAAGTYPSLRAGEAAHADSADTADSASYAQSAGSAATATNAAHADSADTADSASYAQSAGSAATATNAAHADSADTATKATQDGSGNNIAATYATKSELAASGGGSGGFDASGTYPELTAGKAQNVETLYAHYLHGVDTRGGSGQYIYWNTVIVSGEAAAIEEITAADLRAMGYEEGDSFPVSGYIDRGGNGANGAVVGLRLLTNDYLAVEYVDGEGNFVQFPVASALSVDSPEQNGRDVVRRLQ